MKILEVEQGSGEWLKLRLGRPTASNFHRIVMPATAKLSKQARGYAIWLVTERLLNYSLEPVANVDWMMRGKELEPAAVRMYEFEQSVETAPVGFITTDDGRYGASPDRLVVGANAALELKCPAPHTHMGYLLDGFETDYRPQVQGQLLVGEFDWVDRYSFHPELPPARERTYRDEPYIALLRSALDEFCDELDKLMERAHAMGYFAERRQLRTALDEMRAQQDHSEEDPFGPAAARDRHTSSRAGVPGE